MDTSSEMYSRLVDVIDPTNPYSQEDFDKEFTNTSSTLSFNDNFYKIPFKFANKSNNLDPEYATAGSSGFDLRADLKEKVIMPPYSRAIIPTGLFFEIPDNYEIQIRPRSGLAAKNGVTVLNTPGTIDADYRGEIKIILINHGDEDFVVNNGDRIAQAVIASVISKNFVNLTKVSDVSKDTERSDGGFGHTGKK